MGKGNGRRRVKEIREKEQDKIREERYRDDRDRMAIKNRDCTRILSDI